jgi:Domain of unknown function (DUF4129)
VARPLRAGALAIGIVGLLALVAIAARGSHPSPSGHISTRPIPESFQDSLVTLLALVYVAAIVAVVFGLFRYPNRFRDPESRWLLNFALVMVLMLVATAVGYYAITHRHLGSDAAKQQRAQGTPRPGQAGGGRATPVPAREAHFQWPLAFGVAGLVLLAGLWVYVRNRRDGEPLPAATLEADLVAAVETTLEDLRRELDPRRAVIAAYAQMERTLAAHGLARNRADAPLEYLGRVLRTLEVRESAVRTLTHLFEYAKFSRHEIDGAMKEEAIDALLAVRDDLERQQERAA